MSHKINISVFIPTRNRSDRYLPKCLTALESTAKNKNQIEYLVWVDEDDESTIELLKNTKKQMDNLRLFICPRVGFYHIGFMHSNLASVAKGRIFLPFADDCKMTLQNWDQMMCRYIEEDAIIGSGSSFGVTKKCWINHKIYNIYGKNVQYNNEKICLYGNKHNLYRKLPKKWFSVRSKRNSIPKERFLIPENFNILSCEE